MHGPQGLTFARHGMWDQARFPAPTPRASASEISDHRLLFNLCPQRDQSSSIQTALGTDEQRRHITTRVVAVEDTLGSDRMPRRVRIAALKKASPPTPTAPSRPN